MRWIQPTEYLYLGMRPFNPPLSVSSWNGLQEIKFSGGTTYPDHSLEEVLSSVTSPMLQKVAINMSALTKSDDTFGEINGDWDTVDRLLFELGQQRRLKSNEEETLVVEIGIEFGRKQIVDGESINLGKFLGRFRTVGDVDALSDRRRPSRTFASVLCIHTFSICWQADIVVCLVRVCGSRFRSSSVRY